MKRLAVCSVLVLAMGACRSGGGSGDDDNTPDAGSNQDDAIQDIQADTMPVDTPVTIRGVVVTAVDSYGARTGGIYVEEPGGGPYSGVFVFSTPAESNGIVAGDLVDIEGGVKDEFALSTDTTGRTVTEISAPSGGGLVITKVGDGTIPAPEVLNPWDLAANDAEAGKWDSVLIQFNDVAVNSAPRNVSSTDPLLMEMKVTGPYAVTSSLTSLGDTVARDDCYQSITGVGDYFFNYKILPRDAADLVGGGTGCPAQEEGDVACMNSDDDDYDGFTDCYDFSCQDTVAACVADVTVGDIQSGAVDTNLRVHLSNVVVTGVDFNRKNLWVADALAGAENNGIYVFRGFSGASALPGEIVVGATVDVVGSTSEYHGLTELAADQSTGVTFVSAPGAAPTPLTGQSFKTLGDAVDGEPYEGVLVRVDDVELVDRLANNQFSVGDATTPLVVDDEIYRYMTGTGALCFASITGIMHADTSLTTDPAPRILLPRSIDDVVTKTCP